MSTQPQEASGTSVLDTVKLAVAALLLVAGVIAYQYYSDVSSVYRALGMIADGVAAIGLVFATEKGASFLSFFKESRMEVRRVVWPTRQEAVQATLIVVVLVFVVGIFLWMLDMMLSWLITSLLGQGA
ncbi:MAG: preprotein translocase, SecE subunit [Pseudomonadota bacterium]|jgi:preprotein translocase subunit SecE